MTGTLLVVLWCAAVAVWVVQRWQRAAARAADALTAHQVGQDGRL